MRLLVRLLCCLLLLVVCMLCPAAQSEPICNRDSTVGETLNLPVYEWLDPAVSRKGTVLAVHALMMHGASFDRFARHLASSGYAVYAPDLRGFGRWKTESKKFGGDDRVHFSQNNSDLARLSAELRRQNPGIPLICVGESVGADIVFSLLAKPDTSDCFDCVVLCAPGYKARLHPGMRMARDVLSATMHPTKQCNVERFMERCLAKNGEVTKTWRDDPSISRTLSMEEFVKTRLTSRRALNNARKMRTDTPILILAGEEDQAFDTRALPRLAKRMKHLHVSMQTLPDRGHLLLEAQDVNPDVLESVDKWLELHRVRLTADTYAMRTSGEWAATNERWWY